MIGNYALQNGNHAPSNLCSGVGQPDPGSLGTNTRPPTNILQRQEAGTGGSESGPELDLRLSLPLATPEGTPCEGTQLQTITTLTETAQTWRTGALSWLDNFQTHVRRFAPHTEGRFSRIGPVVYRELQMLNAHFGIQEPLWRNRRQRWPMSESDEFPVESFEDFANSINPIRRNFSGVTLSGLSPYCSDTCPQNGEGADRLGSSHPGSNTYTMFFGCFTDNIAEQRLTGVILHEAFHASYSDFNHDTYSFQDHYPGRNALTNADSYATFAAHATLGRDYRRFFRPAEAMEITGEIPSTQSE